MKKNVNSNSNKFFYDHECQKKEHNNIELKTRMTFAIFRVHELEKQILRLPLVWVWINAVPRINAGTPS